MGGLCARCASCYGSGRGGYEEMKAITGVMLIWLWGCTSPIQPPGGAANGDQPKPLEAQGAGLSASEHQCVLAVANDCDHAMAFFDDELGWDSRGADALVAARDGADGLCGTADDTSFESVEALTALPWVGDTALGRLLEHVTTSGCVAAEAVCVVEGVPFSAQEADDTIALVQTGSSEWLRHDVGVSAKAASGIILARPFDPADPGGALAQLGEVPWVGPATLTRLREFASAVHAPNATPAACAGSQSVDGVELSGAEAHIVLDFANHATPELLQAISGLGPVLATRIVSERPYGDVQAIGAVSGVGPSLTSTLRDEAAAIWCELDAASCECDVLEGGIESMDIASAIVTDPTGAPMARFHQLLGEAGFELALPHILAAVEALLEDPSEAPHDEDSAESAAMNAVLKVLPQAVFLRPFATLPATPPALDLATSRQAAVDGLITALGESSLEDTDVGVSFDELATSAEAEYLADISAWRGGEANAVQPNLMTHALSHAWIFEGAVLGIPCSVTVSRKTGAVLGVEIDPNG